jgi:hypothetical protein
MPFGGNPTTDIFSLVFFSLTYSGTHGGERMAFDNLPPSKPAARRAKNEPIFCAGWRVFVHWPARGTQTPGPLPLVDADGKPLANDLVDGQQVEIVSWRPRSREGLAYRIRRLADDSEWWISGQYLRRHRVAERVGDPAVGLARR